MPGVWKYDHARIVAVCDLDSRRTEDARTLVNGYYGRKTGRPYDGVKGYLDYRELLQSKDVDAVLVSTPDHWHALIAITAVEAGKDVYLQKPASLTIADGRALSNAVHRTGRIFQIGSQQRSSPQFRRAAELVRNGRVGQLRTVQVGLPGDPPGGRQEEMPVHPPFIHGYYVAGMAHSNRCQPQRRVLYRTTCRASDAGWSGGVIINMGSTNGLMGYPYYADYNASKAGVIELSRSMALELAPTIRVNALCPGFIMTPMQEAEYTPEMRKTFEDKVPLRTLGKPDDVAALFAFLASDDAGFITGQHFVIDGGEITGGLASQG